MSNVVELERGRRGVWVGHGASRRFQPIDTPVIRPPETTHFCNACGCWLTHDLEPCPACAAHDYEEFRRAHEAAVRTLIARHRREYEDLLGGPHEERETA